MAIRLQEIKNARQHKRFGRQIHHFENCASTNDLALDLARLGANDGTLIIADEQSKGRGRQGRSWLTVKDGLAFSIVIRPSIRVEHAHRLTLISAAALLHALRRLNIDARLKWPNDILIPHDGNVSEGFGSFKKVAGILVEISSVGSHVESAVIGIGINVARDANHRLLEDAVPHAGFLSDAGFVGDTTLVLLEVLDDLDEYLHDLRDSAHFARCLEEQRRHSATLGHLVSIREGERSIHGDAVAINADGSLQIVVDGKNSTIYAGDVWLS